MKTTSAQTSVQPRVAGSSDKKRFRDRRQALRDLAAFAALPACALALRQSGLIVELAHADAEAIDRGARSPFLLYVHLGSICGIASGLCQPTRPDDWQKGIFTRGESTGARNPLLNKHTAAGSLVLTDYSRVLSEIHEHLCLVNGTPQSLDHNVASRLQATGSGIAFGGPEWAAAVTQNSRTASRPNPLLMSGGSKTFSVSDITLMSASSLAQFRTATTDADAVPRGAARAFQPVISSAMRETLLSGLKPGFEERESLDRQAEILLSGLKELDDFGEQIADLEKAMSPDEFNLLKAGLDDGANIQLNQALRNRFVLAGALAVTGLAHGMTVIEGGHDLHNGGADVLSARYAAGYWILVTLFWRWVKRHKLQDDVMVLTSHDFGRSPYNQNSLQQQRIKVAGKDELIDCPGRDHALYFGMMFLNGRMPPGGRLGNISDNLIALPGADLSGGVASTAAHVSVDVVGSMLMRAYPEIFPTERIVRKFWPEFKEIALLTAGARRS